MKKKFIITIDTEGDDLWKNKITSHGIKPITTENGKNLERFQILCEKYGFVPTYLTNYEMTQSKEFVDMARWALKKKNSEIGMHMHAWNSPPLKPLPYHPKGTHTYLGEYDHKVQWEKMKYMTHLLEDTFQEPITSFRNGRWYFDGFTLKCLKKLNYIVDCTMTPGISWADQIGNRLYGTDYSQDKYIGDYMMANRTIHRAGISGIYEVPPTILPKYKWLGMKIVREYLWLRPNGNNLEQMIWIKNQVKKDKRLDYLEFMIHSSELTYGVNPTFKSKQSIERLYSDLQILFSEIAKDFEGTGITQFIRDKYRRE